VVSWNPVNDSFTLDLKNSEMIHRIALKYGVGREEVLEEVYRRALLFRELRKRGVKANREVKNEITRYYLLNPFPIASRRIGG